MTRHGTGGGTAPGLHQGCRADAGRGGLSGLRSSSPWHRMVVAPQRLNSEAAPWQRRGECCRTATAVFASAVQNRTEPNQTNATEAAPRRHADSAQTNCCHRCRRASPCLARAARGPRAPRRGRGAAAPGGLRQGLAGRIGGRSRMPRGGAQLTAPDRTGGVTPRVPGVPLRQSSIVLLHRGGAGRRALRVSAERATHTAAVRPRSPG